MALAIRSIKVLTDSGVDWRFLLNGPRGIPRTAILAELSRLPDPRSIPPAAKAICESLMSTRKAIAMIRRYRLGNREPDFMQLGRSIRKVIRRYRETHPGLNDRDLRDAFDFALKFP